MGLTIEGSAMAAGIGGCLLLSGLFFYLAARSRRRSARWRGAVRLPAVVTSLEYQEAWRGQREINDHRSSTQVNLCFVDQGRRYQRQRQYPGIVLTPQLGQKVPILFQRDSGDWIPRSEARVRWPLFLALGGGFLAAGLALLLDGPGILASRKIRIHRARLPAMKGLGTHRFRDPDLTRTSLPGRTGHRQAARQQRLREPGLRTTAACTGI